MLITRRATRRGGALVLGLVCSGMVVVGIGSRPAAGTVTAVSGSAFGYTTSLSLFFAPPTVRGFGQTIPPGNLESESPSVVLPPGGSASPITVTDTDGAKGSYGPGTFFSGITPDSSAVFPPSGPITTSTQGTTAGGSVTSSVDIVLYPAPIEVPCAPTFPRPCTAPGGFGPGPPVSGEQLHSTCTVTERSVTGSTTFVNGTLVLSTAKDGDPVLQEPLPDKPPVNYTREGTLDEVGDTFTVVLNEQFFTPRGLTVNAVHVIAQGPTAIGDMIIGQVQCGVTATADPTTTTTGGGTTSTTRATTTSSSSTTSTSSSSTTSSSTTTTTGGSTTTTRNPSTGTTTPAGRTAVGSGALEKNLGQLARTGAELRWLLILGSAALLLGWLFTLGARARGRDGYG